MGFVRLSYPSGKEPRLSRIANEHAKGFFFQKNALKKVQICNHVSAELYYYPAVQNLTLSLKTLLKSITYTSLILFICSQKFYLYVMSVKSFFI